MGSKDNDRPDYEIEGLAVFRYIEPRFINMPDEEIVHLYKIWSDEKAAAGWLGVTKKGAEEFCKWAFTPPADYYK